MKTPPLRPRTNDVPSRFLIRPVRLARTGARRWVVLLAAMGVWGSPRLDAQVDRHVAPEPWPAELGEAFELYYAHEFLEVQRVCRRLSASTRDAVLRREAAALAAMATMHLPGRTNRVSGRAQLAQLAEEDVSLLTRPECQLAYGVAQSALSETATALYHLSEAAETFAARGQTDRVAEACVALAETWARHGEWELVMPGLEARRPDTLAEADRIRRERIRAVRERVAGLPGSETYLERIDLILARHLLESEDGAAEGTALLEQLAGRQNVSRTIGEACLALAERYETARRWTDAADLYARVQAAQLGESSREAEQRSRAIRQAQLVLDVPGQVSIGARVSIGLRARNLEAVECEVRRVDLAAWLNQRQGRFAEAALPTSGAVVMVRTLRTNVGAEHDWWLSDTLDEPLEFEAPPGAVVILARAVDEVGRQTSSKQLVLAGDVRATAFVGGQRAVIWATRGERAGTDDEQPACEARFWMHGSFVPLRPRFDAGIATFALPPEARLLRDKRWICLVQAGEHVTLCRGKVPAELVDRAPTVALTGGPPAPLAGQQLQIFGKLLGGAPTADAAAQPVELDLLDSLDNLLNTSTTTVSDAGTFSASLPITEELAGKNLRVVARRSGRVLEQVFSLLRARAARADEAIHRVRCVLPPWLPMTHKGLVGLIEATYPWGTPVGETIAIAGIRAVRLPSTEYGSKVAHSSPIEFKCRLDQDGKFEFVQPFDDFHLPDGPLAIGAWIDAAGWDDRFSRHSAESLIGPQQVHAWLEIDTDSPRVGEPLRVSMHWFDPSGCAVGARPTVQIWRGGQPFAPLELLPAAHGVLSRTWRPTAPGPHELVATLPLNAAAPLTVRETIEVSGSRDNAEPNPSPVQFEAAFTETDGRPAVRAQLRGRRTQPVLLLLEDDEPLAARELPSLDGSADLLIPLPRAPRAATRLVVAGPGEQGARIVGAADVAPAAEDALQLELAIAPDPEVTRSSEVRLVATVTRGAAKRRVENVIVMTRLVDASHSGSIPWLPGESRADLLLMPGGIQIASAVETGAAAYGYHPIPETRELPAQLARALFEGSTIWVGAAPSANGEAALVVPLPAAPGFYRLQAAAWSPDGNFVTESVDLDTRSDLELSVDVPERMLPGDRGYATLILANKSATAKPVRVIFDGGPGLQIEELRPRPPAAPTVSAEGAGRLAVTLAPQSTITIQARLEAATPGPGEARLTVETEHGRQTAHALYQIVRATAAEDSGASEESATADIEILRTLYLLEKPAAHANQAAIEGGELQFEQTRWRRVEFESERRVYPGQLILVEERIVTAQLLEHVDWIQEIPGNCFTHTGERGELAEIGTSHGLRRTGTSYQIDRLEAGQHTREYVIVALRPGVCGYPAAELRAEGRRLRVRTEPERQFVFVADSN